MHSKVLRIQFKTMFYCVHRRHELGVRNRTGYFTRLENEQLYSQSHCGFAYWLCSFVGLLYLRFDPLFILLVQFFYIWHDDTMTFRYFPLVYTSDIMAVPPSYSDLGKAAKDIFSKGYGKKTHSALLKTICIVQ